jgi:hypothetical protein
MSFIVNEQKLGASIAEKVWGKISPQWEKLKAGRLTVQGKIAGAEVDLKIGFIPKEGEQL